MVDYLCQLFGLDKKIIIFPYGYFCDFICLIFSFAAVSDTYTIQSPLKFESNVLGMFEFYLKTLEGFSSN